MVSRYQVEISSSNRTNDAVWRVKLLSNVEIMRCEMPSEMREEMMSGVRVWVTADNAIDAEGSMNEELNE